MNNPTEEDGQNSPNCRQQNYLAEHFARTTVVISTQSLQHRCPEVCRLFNSGSNVYKTCEDKEGEAKPSPKPYVGFESLFLHLQFYPSGIVTDRERDVHHLQTVINVTTLGIASNPRTHRSGFCGG